MLSDLRNVDELYLVFSLFQIRNFIKKKKLDTTASKLSFG